ncbi:odorant receptor 43a isoform X5 [Nasonia vitripennis]|uniref:Odorant receptor n=1 Tax=Nasonia vitripennis TaxID=7425 RepID=A0A7M7QBM6_NASVI|nr:odorant receptor 43a isoform X5 [Nasonia vitripennis]
MGKWRESKSEFYEDRLFVINKKFLQILGRWPYQAKRSRIFLLSLYFVGILTVVVAELIHFVRVIRIKDIPKIIDCLPALIFTYGAMVMIFNSMIKFAEMRQILGKIEENWLSARDAEEYALLKEFAEEGRFLIIGYTLCIIGSLATYSLEPLVPQILDKLSPLNESRPIKTFLEVEYLVDHRRYYTAIYLHNMQAACWVILTVLAIDAYFVMIVQHACSMFAVLGLRIGKIGSGSPERIASGRIIECLKLHKSCIEFAGLIESSFTASLLLQLFLNMVVISVTGVQTINRREQPGEMLKFSLSSLSVMTRLFYISWPGQKMIDHSLRVRELVVAWYELPAGSRRLLLLMLLRSSRACHITAGGMFPMNFETYCRVSFRGFIKITWPSISLSLSLSLSPALFQLMQTSMSYFTMILSTQ